MPLQREGVDCLMVVVPVTPVALFWMKKELERGRVLVQKNVIKHEEWLRREGGWDE